MSLNFFSSEYALTIPDT